MYGWEPRETHTYYDAAGEPCVAAEAHTTVVTRETEWDDEQVTRMLALDYIEAGVCACGCGLPREVAHDEKSNLATQSVICHARKWLTVDQRDAEQSAKHPKDRDPKWVAGQALPGDGVLWSVFQVPTPAPDPGTGGASS